VVGVHKSHTAKFYTLVPNILSIIITVFFFSLASKNLYQVTCSKQKVPDTVIFTSHSRIVGPHYGTCCLPPRIWRWLLQFWKSCASLQSVLFHCAFCFYGTYCNVSGSRRRCCRYLAIVCKCMTHYELKGGLQTDRREAGVCVCCM